MAVFYRNRRRFPCLPDLFVALDRGQGHQLVLDCRKPRSDDGLDDLARRLIDVLRLVDGDHAIDVYDDARLSISRIHCVLFQRFPGGSADIRRPDPWLTL